VTLAAVFEPVEVLSEAVVVAINVNGPPISCRAVLIENMGCIPDTGLGAPIVLVADDLRLISRYEL
jgi:hypothetical protein